MHREEDRTGVSALQAAGDTLGAPGARDEGDAEAPATSAEVLDAFIERSWRSNAERQRAKGAEFVIGRRQGVRLWNLEGTHCVIDCGTGGGVHSLGHRHPEVLAALQGALDEGRDTGLWSVPNAPYLAFQDRLRGLSPSPDLNRSVVTLCSTLSVDLATMFAFRATGRRKLAAFRHGYHGHTGFAAQLTGSPDEGVIDHYNLPTDLVTFFERYGDLEELDALLGPHVAALIVEPMNYESFEPATREYMDGVTRLCRERGVLLIIDETRTGLGRTGRLWASEHYDLRPDMLITGKGLSGGLYPASAVLVREPIYETCMNEHPFAYISSLGGNELSCSVAARVLEVSSRPALLENVQRVSRHLEDRFRALCHDHPETLTAARSFGCILAVGVADRDVARFLYAALFEEGVLCHSISELDPPALKFFPPLVLTTDEADEVARALEAALRRVGESREWGRAGPEDRACP